MTDLQLQAFMDRVDGLRRERKLTRGQLAKQAGLAPATLSRLLSGARPLRMEHAVLLASALGVTATDLVAGTKEAAALESWVSRSRFEEVERQRADALREVDVERTRAAGMAVEIERLRAEVHSQLQRVEQAERRTREAAAEAAGTHAVRAEVQTLRGQLTTISAERDGLVAQVTEKNAAIADCHERLDAYARALEQATDSAQRLQHDLHAAKGGQVGTAIAGAALGGILASLLAPKRSGRR